MGIMLVYDTTNEKSFENIKNWIRNIEEKASTDVEKILIGNKCECHEKRQVSKTRGEILATGYMIDFFETSAKEGINVYEAFYKLASNILKRENSKTVSTFWMGVVVAVVVAVAVVAIFYKMDNKTKITGFLYIANAGQCQRTPIKVIRSAKKIFLLQMQLALKMISI